MRPIDAHRVENLLQMCGSYHGVIAYDTVISILHDVPTVDVPDTDVVEQKDIGFERALAYVHGWSDCFSEHRWIPVTERLPEEEFEKGRANGTVYDLYPCLVTRKASHSVVDPERIYVAKHYFDGEIFVDNGGYDCHKDVTAWMPLPELWKGETDDN